MKRSMKNDHMLMKKFIYTNIDNDKTSCGNLRCFVMNYVQCTFVEKFHGKSIEKNNKANVC